MHALIRVAVVLSLALTASGQGIYHEAWCPSVDVARMPRLSRTAAVAKGLEPAADCHPTLHVTYLGQLALPELAPQRESDASADRPIHVNPYVRKDGTPVREHWRSAPTDH